MKQFYSKSLNVIFLVPFLTVVFLTSCSKSGSNPAPKSPAPVLAITSLSVNTGPYNTSVIISGTAFSPTTTSNQVFFNGKAATVTAATTTQITATVPLGAGTGNVTVSVNNGTAVSGPLFTYQLTAFITTFAGNGKPATIDGTGVNASIHGPSHIAIDGSNNLFITDVYTNSIRKITPDGTVTTLAGGTAGFADGKGAAAQFVSPCGLAADAAGNIYVADGTSEIRKITPDGTVSTFAGQLYSTTEKDGQGTAASFVSPFGLGFDQSGNLYVADLEGNTIRKITPGGLVSTIAGSGKAQTVNGKGILASFQNPVCIAVDHNGNIYVGDSFAGTGQGEIRKITPDTTVTTIVMPETIGVGVGGITFDNNGVLYISDPTDYRIQAFSTPGVLSIISNSSGSSVPGPNNTSVTLSPTGVVFDKSGNLFYADDINNLIMKVTLK